MKAIIFDDFGSADVLRLGEAPMPNVRPTDLLVKVMAAGVNRADLAKGETVLVHAAAGGIGSAAVKLAKAAGTTVLATASANNIENVLSLGADAVFDYRQADFEAEIVDTTASRGVDLIIDFVGGSYLARNIRGLAPGGRLVQVGLLGRDKNAIIPLDIVLHNHLQLMGTVMKSRSRSEKRAMIGRFREQVLPRVGHELKPVIGATYSLAAVSDAHRRMEAGGLFGKVVLTGFHE
ncbi:zinc-binding dehydrogenase [Rhizobium sp. BK379]|uniref:zinc-binding dehydrogenase n=1 Tax=Rhizobium sp. BK379 TaxID=2587059 RepID=UPI00161FDC85|nr:zinc-binding dehydrogenase [Rhizobium sp. BK379]MBB3444441.1 NADPH:quinone reductase-like Zn-dependent oxidoreductase [Rhizobium sp. BK379]